MNLPKANETNETGNLAVTYVQTIIEQNHWIFRRQGETNDFGIDAEIEIKDKNMVTGKLCKCQVKGTQHLEWKDDSTTVQVKVSTFNLWRSTHLPVIVFLVDIKQKEVYWSIPLQHQPKDNAETVSIRFQKENSLNGSFKPFREFLQSWYTAFSTDNILREVPYFNSVFKELKDMIDGGDPWCQIGEEEDAKTRLFYRHVLQLRSSMGLTNLEIPSIDDWYIRSASLWEDDFRLFHSTFSELMLFLKPYYEEAHNILFSRLSSVEPCFENQELINYYIHSQQGNENVSYTYRDERFDNPSFHKYLEDKLKKTDALRSIFSDKKKK